MEQIDQNTVDANQQSDVPAFDKGFVGPIISAALLTACGGGGGGSSSGGSSSVTPPPANNAAVASVDAARFLSQAGFAATDADIQYVVSSGKEAWINKQAAMTQSISRVNWLVNAGYSSAANMNNPSSIDAALWHHLIAEQNQLVQRVTLFWSEFFVVSMLGLPVNWPQFMAASYMDTLEKNALGNFKDLLKAVTLSPGMGEHLGVAGSQKSDPATNRQPDENYAREVMQLMTIGLYQLNQDGSAVIGANGQPIPTYTQADVMGLAAAFSGWNFNGSSATYTYTTVPMVMNESVHQGSTTNSFLGTSIPAGTTGTQSLEIVLNTLFNHQNVAPFVSKQLIQRLVSSNPSPAYVSRVAQVFNNNGQGVRGDMLAVVKAAMLDAEASQPVANATGKVREPMVRFVQWAKTFNASSATNAWGIRDTSDPSTRLSQSPMRSPSVFNFFSPDYVPSGLTTSPSTLVAPEMQITDVVSVAGYLNFLQTFVASGVADVIPNYANELAVANSTDQLIARLNLLLAANQLSAATLNNVTNAVNSIAASNGTALANRVYAAIFLIMASPDYLVIR